MYQLTATATIAADWRLKRVSQGSVFPNREGYADARNEWAKQREDGEASILSVDLNEPLGWVANMFYLASLCSKTTPRSGSIPHCKSFPDPGMESI